MQFGSQQVNRISSAHRQEKHSIQGQETEGWKHMNLMTMERICAYLRNANNANVF